MSFIFFISFLFLNAQNKTQPTPNARIWSEIDKINKELKTSKKPLSTTEFTRWLERASLVLNDSEFETNYQEVRSWAFENNFHQAEALSKRAAPVFFISFDGDYDYHELSYSFFKTLVTPKSEAADFMTGYPKYKEALPLLNPSWTFECLVPFNIGLSSTDKKVVNKSEVLKEWKLFRANWKDRWLSRFSETAVRCLEPAKKN